MFDGAGAIQLGHGLGPLAGENVDLALRREQTGFAVLQLRDLFAQRRVRLLRALEGAGTGLHQPVVAGLFLLGELQIGFGGGDICRFLFHDRMLQGDLGVEIEHRGFRRRDIGTGLVQRRAEIALVDPGQHLSGLHRLVVVNQHFRDIAGHLRRDDRGVGLDVGVIGRFQISPGGEVAVAEVCRRGDAERQRHGHGGALDRPPGRTNSGFGKQVSSIG